MAFKELRRQKYLGEPQFSSREGEILNWEQIAIEKTAVQAGHPDAHRAYLWDICTGRLELLILRYTAGHPVSELCQQLPSVIEAFDHFIPFDNPRPNEAHSLTITQHEAYVYVLWLLALCTLLGHAELVPKVLGWLNLHADFNRGRDTIFERIVEKLTGSMDDPGRYALHPDAYRPLGKAILAENPEDHPALVKEFLENWYKNMKECYWHGTHTDKEGSSYFGYWAFEAALVTYLWDIDDASYRDHLVYPKDLVDFAREHFPYKGAPSGDDSAGKGRCEGGQPCPQTGFWFTPAKTHSRRYFKAGEVMPQLGGDYGSTIWQWDINQEPPKI